MKKLVLSFSLCFMMLCTAVAQDTKAPASAAPTVAVVATNGLVGAAYSPSGNSMFLNFGGPGIKCSVKKWSFGVAMYPSMRLRLDEKLPNVSAQLGGGFNVAYDRFSIIVPFYLTGSSPSGIANVEMAPAFGLAVRIGK